MINFFKVSWGTLYKIIIRESSEQTSIRLQVMGVCGVVLALRAFALCQRARAKFCHRIKREIERELAFAYNHHNHHNILKLRQKKERALFRPF